MGELEGGADGRECTGERSVRARGGGAYIQGPAGTLWQHGHGRAIHTVLTGHPTVYGALS